MVTIQDIIDVIEEQAPTALQESYDNAGMQVGETSLPATGAVLCVDVTEDVVDEAIALGANLIVSHHPLLFHGLKRITGRSYIERVVMKALRNQIAIYAAHTNLDAAVVNYRWAEMLGLADTQVLQPVGNMLLKLVTYVPETYAESVRQALFAAGAGCIGRYDCCSYTSDGVGSFRAGIGTKPFCGALGELHHEPECRIEVVLPRHLKSRAVKALLNAHPYEEPAYDLLPLDNLWHQVGHGIVGRLPEPMPALDFLNRLKQIMPCESIRHTAREGQYVHRVALCGGGGSFLIDNAVAAKADIFVTGEIGFHNFFGYENTIILAEIGHYESERHTKAIFFDVIRKKFPTFATYLTKVETNPIKYL